MRIVYTEQDGVAATITPTDPLRIDSLISRMEAKGFSPFVVAKENLPSREFRGAWKVSGESCIIDMASARNIHMDRIRKKRDEALSVKDVDYIKADEAGNTTLKAEIAAQKQYLRDIPQNFDLESCSTPEELSAAWPPGLDR